MFNKEDNIKLGLKICYRNLRIDLFGSEQGPVACCCCEYGDELSCSIQGGGFRDQLKSRMTLGVQGVRVIIVLHVVLTD